MAAATQTAGEVHELALGAAVFSRPREQGDLHGFRPIPSLHRLLGQGLGPGTMAIPDPSRRTAVSRSLQHHCRRMGVQPCHAWQLEFTPPVSARFWPIVLKNSFGGPEQAQRQTPTS